VLDAFYCDIVKAETWSLEDCTVMPAVWLQCRLLGERLSDTQESSAIVNTSFTDTVTEVYFTFDKLIHTPAVLSGHRQFQQELRISSFSVAGSVPLRKGA